MKKILKFEYMNVEFALYIDKGNLVYQKLENGVCYNYLEKGELELINKVLIKLIPNKNIKDLGYLKYNNKEINHLYDLDTNLHLFHEKEKITKDCFILNKIFNNQYEYVAQKDIDDNKDLEYTRRNVKFGKMILSVLVSSTLLLSSSLLWIKGGEKVISIIDYYKEENKYQEGVLEYQNKEISFDEIIESINSNSNLTQDEKCFFLSNPNFFLDNLEYFDYYTVLDNLKRLRIEYVSDTKKGTYGEFVTNGKNRGLIKIYGATCFNDAKLSALSHEFLHSFTKYSSDNYFYEILNVILNNEYFGSSMTLYDNCYSNLREYFYIICELIDAECLRKYHAENDINYLKNALMQIIPDSTMATDLLTDIDFICRIELLKDNNVYEYLKLKEELNLKKQIVKDLLKTYYETKYSISITQDLNILFWFDYSKCVDEIANNLDFDECSRRCVDDYVTIKQFKNIFTKTENNLIISLCDQVNEVTRNYTLEELLDGYFQKKEDIYLPMNTDGTYIGVTYEPLHFIDYEVISYEKELSK